MGKINIHVFQDEQDIRCGMVQLAIQESNRNATQYFTLEEWAAFKEYVNAWTPAKSGLNYENNPLTQADYCNLHKKFEVDMYFGGSLFNINLYFQGQKIWRKFKKAINDFKPEQSGESGPGAVDAGNADNCPNPAIGCQQPTPKTTRSCRCQSCPSELISKCKRFEEKCIGL